MRCSGDLVPLLVTVCPVWLQGGPDNSVETKNCRRKTGVLELLLFRYVVRYEPLGPPEPLRASDPAKFVPTAPPPPPPPPTCGPFGVGPWQIFTASQTGDHPLQPDNL
ncbi:hypothetical protein ZHAS_00011121 [Anopheles sinensis]|uniref:Uncharacterized protein n=1 Tax=Anopheles sinensis TaxID=74873 RepID=A0A084VZD5_ANOSI|nr:hypothetical protein ZHAS_00011121 [Anopheles sinensis]